MKKIYGHPTTLPFTTKRISITRNYTNEFNITDTKSLPNDGSLKFNLPKNLPHNLINHILFYTGLDGNMASNPTEVNIKKKNKTLEAVPI